MESLTTFICTKLPSVVARYDILEEIDRGGQGAVVLVRERQRSIERALKISLDFDGQAETLGRFEREARVLSELNHPNVVTVVEYGSENNIPFMVMDKVSGQSLKAIVESSLEQDNELPDVQWTVDTFREVADALAYCHSKGVLHRDVKPDNILIDSKTGQAVLIDFGVAKRERLDLSGTSEGTIASLTKTGELVGTPAFMSPEQLDVSGTHGEINEKSDVWSLGATLFYCLSGQPPFGDKNAAELFGALMHSSPERVASYNREVPIWLDRLCANCFTKQRKRPTMKGLVDALENEGKKGASKRILVALGVLALFFLGFVVSNYEALTKGPPSLASRGDLKVWVTSKTYIFHGETNHKGLTFYFGKESVVSDSEGRIRISLDLKEGENRFPVHASSFIAGDYQEELIVHLDSRAPKFVLGKPVDGQSVRLKKGEGLSGRVTDASPVTLYFNGKERALDEQNRFDLSSLELASVPDEAVLAVVDVAGNRTEISVKLERNWQVPSRLEDLSLWVTASRSQQKAAALEVAKHLKADYQYLGIKTYRCQAVKYRLATYKHKKTGLELRLIPGGRYSMGSNDKRGPNTRPIHSVAVKPFLAGAREVSWGIWRSTRPDPQAAGWKKDLPVEKRRWATVQSWLKVAGGGLRLPSEAEWEYACRAGTTTAYFWGQTLVNKYCWISINTGETPRSTRLHDSARNAFGLADMIGNVAEWCEDNYIPHYKYGPNNQAPRKLVNNQRYVGRGGSYNRIDQCYSAGRHPYDRYTVGVGFRVFRSLP